MKKVVVWETNGKRFDVFDDAVKYEKLCKKVAGIMSQLLPRTKDVEDCLDYNKHNLYTLWGCFRAFCKLCAVIIPDYKEWFEQAACGERDKSHIGRILDDSRSDYPILYDAYFRFACIDFNTGFEFQQPYYANHVEEAFSDIKRNKEYKYKNDMNND